MENLINKSRLLTEDGHHMKYSDNAEERAVEYLAVAANSDAITFLYAYDKLNDVIAKDLAKDVKAELLKVQEWVLELMEEKLQQLLEFAKMANLPITERFQKLLVQFEDDFEFMDIQPSDFAISEGMAKLK